jgi:membrane protease YdiL (CAAX protease family)
MNLVHCALLMHPTSFDTRPVTPADRAIIVLSLLLPTAVTWLYFVALNDAPAALQRSAYGIGKSIQFALPVVWVCLVQRQRPNLQLPSSKWLIGGGLFGLAVAAAATALYFGVLKPEGMFDAPAAAVRAKVESFGAASPPMFLLLALFYSTIHSLLEEYYWRWFVFRQLDRWIKLPAAIAISSIAFAAHHVLVLAHYFGGTSPLTWLFTAAVAIGGAIWAWFYRASGSIYAPWLSHAIVDAAIFAVGYDVIT